MYIVYYTSTKRTNYQNNIIIHETMRNIFVSIKHLNIITSLSIL